jgi:hypothetical protein
MWGVPPEYFYSDFNVIVMPGNSAGNIYPKIILVMSHIVLNVMKYLGLNITPFHEKLTRIKITRVRWMFMLRYLLFIFGQK